MSIDIQVLSSLCRTSFKPKCKFIQHHMPAVVWFQLYRPCRRDRSNTRDCACRRQFTLPVDVYAVDMTMLRRASMARLPAPRLRRDRRVSFSR